MSDNGSSERRETRYNIFAQPAARNEGSAEEAVSVSNLSASGCRFMLERKLPIGAPVSIRAGNADIIAGEVKWQLDQAHGMQFDQPLDPAALEELRLFLSEQPAYILNREAGGNAS